MKSIKNRWSLEDVKKLFVLILFLCVTLPSEVVLAESLADFQNVVGLKGCASIPYNDERRRCMDFGADKYDWCVSAEWSCEKVAGTKSYLDSVAAIKKKIDREHEDKGLLENRYSNANEAERPGLKKQISDTDENIAKLWVRHKEQLEWAEGAKRELELRLQAGAKCLDARTQVQQIFNTAITRAKGESDPAIQAITQQLIYEWTNSTSQHQTAFSETTTGYNRCKDRLDGKY